MSLYNSSFKEVSIPKGVIDLLPEQADKIGYIEDKIRKVFELWGFRRIIPPMLEYEDVLSVGMDDDLKAKAFRFEDRQSGRLLVIPPDITPQVARIEAMRMSGYPLPHRFYYNGRVLRHAESQSGRSREIFQSGVELIGLDSPEADAEMVAMAVEILHELGIVDFKIDLGQVEFFRGIINAALLDDNTKQRIQSAVAKKEVTLVQEILDKENIADNVKEEIMALPRLFGGIEVLKSASGIVHNQSSQRALDNLRQVVEILKIHGVSDQLTIDLGEIRGLHYHTGITFEGFIPHLGEPVCGGGRYDTLMSHYGVKVPATGFAFNLLALLRSLEKQPDVEASKSRDILLFNNKSDRRDVLEIAAMLRRNGYSVARDIIHHDSQASLAYAERMNILYVMVVGDESLQQDEISLIRVSDRYHETIKRPDLLNKVHKITNSEK